MSLAPRLTDAQVEFAARTLCGMRGDNPAELVSHSPPPDPLGMSALVVTLSPRWTLVAKELRDLELKMAAIEAARLL